MDFSKLENIIFVAVSAVLAVFLFVMLFVLISKGKRKTCGLDIFLRVFTPVIMLVCLASLALTVLSELDGDYRLAVSTEGELTATLLFGASAVSLPAPAFFVSLVSQTGREIVIGLLLLAFIVLVADCMSAKRGKAKSKAPAPRKSAARSAEEIKRRAEIERIRRLGDNAVKKTNAAADTQAHADVPEHAEQQPEHAEQQPEQPAADDEPDWLRTATAESDDWRDGGTRSTEFVGLVGLDEQSDFDTFDDIDAPEKEADETDQTEEYENNDNADEEYENNDNADEALNANETDAEQTDGGQVDADYEGDTSEEPVADEADQTEENELGYGADEAFDTDEANAEQTDGEQVDADYESDTNEEPDDAWFERGGESEVLNDDHSEPIEQTIGDAGADGPAYDPVDGETGVTPVEPDRDIYIPKMRTVERAGRDAHDRQTREPRTDRPKSSSTKKGGGARKSAAKSGGGKGASAKRGHDPKDLPVTRRYVILDRTSAVNIFSDYLKERDKADKDKLESSISTIIIK